jgi:ATP synthase subunit 6
MLTNNSKNFFISSLEQFNIESTLFSSTFLPLTNNFFSFTIFFLILFLGVRGLQYNSKIYLTSYFVEVLNFFYSFILLVIRDNIRGRANLFIPFFSFLFFLILGCNMNGLIPFSYALTSTLIFICFLAFTLFFGFNLIGIIIHGKKFLIIFLPPGITLILTPFLLLIEFISYFARILSLAIRLFANIVAGHTLLKILIESFYSIILTHYSIFSFILLILIIGAVTTLELVIAFLQAYIFLVLGCIYSNEVINLH